MKRLGVLLGAFIATAILSAGGNVTPKLSNVVEIPAQACKENKVYVERDAQLMWQDQAYSEAENGAFKRQYSSGKAGIYTHAVNYCKRLNYAGYSDWRLPTADELTGVHEHKEQVFSYFRDNDFWTSTPTTQNRYYVIFPADAIQYPRSKQQSNYIRCVRCTVNDQ